MSDYINRDEFIESKRFLYCENCSRRKNGNGKIVYDIGDAPCRACGIGDVLDDVEDFPAADVVERKRGEWKVNSVYIKCSVCGEAFMLIPQNYCPNCGAEMRTIIEAEGEA